MIKRYRKALLQIYQLLNYTQSPDWGEIGMARSIVTEVIEPEILKKIDKPKLSREPEEENPAIFVDGGTTT